ncbi:tyrosine-type recombinase/integrase [Chamaesiphon minutus]|uniref:Site-specific recombinase XerD n=1 Tax=Chamaesiphon minutus (strain ATCC 27169 / PCC 6605) TaxID=1173020 RepID=K9UP46_CHAP6|nr:tyrosine-type recombinase/integrase [Chamaesiphon minutus]AFY96857.1 site-specific recombinase XerD [Chamaesiphon minutus PCC 6605]
MFDIKITVVKPAIAGSTGSEGKLSPNSVTSGIWAEFLSLQISSATRRSYAAALKDFFQRELETEVSVATIESFLRLPEREAIGHVLNYRGQLLTAGLAAATVNARLAALRSFVIHAYKRKLCNFRLDDIKSVKAQSYKDTRGISIELFQQLIDEIDRSTSMGRRDYAMLRLLWDNALRRAEVCGLDRVDFHPGEARLYLKGKGRIDKEPIDLAAATVEAISDWLASMGESKSLALFVSSRDTRLSVDRLYQIVGGLAQSAGIDRVVSPHKIRHSSITALLDLNGGDVRSAQAHSRHKNLATLIRYDDGRQQLQGKAAKTLADAILERDVD